jgi:hypothetical protein
LITIDNICIWVTVGDEKIFPQESDDESDDNDSVWSESEKQAPKKAKEADESSNNERKGKHYSEEEITLLRKLHREGYKATAICKFFPGRSKSSIESKIQNTIKKKIRFLSPPLFLEPSVLAQQFIGRMRTRGNFLFGMKDWISPPLKCNGKKSTLTPFQDCLIERKLHA